MIAFKLAATLILFAISIYVYAKVVPVTEKEIIIFGTAIYFLLFATALCTVVGVWML